MLNSNAYSNRLSEKKRGRERERAYKVPRYHMIVINFGYYESFVKKKKISSKKGLK